MIRKLIDGDDADVIELDIDQLVHPDLEKKVISRDFWSELRCLGSLSFPGYPPRFRAEFLRISDL